MSKEEIIKIIDDTLQEFYDCEGGDNMVNLEVWLKNDRKFLFKNVIRYNIDDHQATIRTRNEECDTYINLNEVIWITEHDPCNFSCEELTNKVTNGVSNESANVS